MMYSNLEDEFSDGNKNEKKRYQGEYGNLTVVSESDFSIHCQPTQVALVLSIALK